MLLKPIYHPQIGRTGQVSAAGAQAFRESIPRPVRSIRPGQIRPRRRWLLAFLALGPATPRIRLLRRRWGLARIVILRRRAGRVLTVTRQQMLHPGQPLRQRLVGLHQLRDLPGHPRDLPIQGSDPRIPLTHKPDQLITRQLLQHRHRKTNPTPHDQADTPNTHNPTFKDNPDTCPHPRQPEQHPTTNR
jgi:hypothetical protein